MQSKMASQLVGTELSPSVLQQIKIVIRWKDRGDPELSHKDRYDVYNIKIVMQFPSKREFKNVLCL